MNRLFDVSNEAPTDQVVVAIGNPARRQTWQQVLEQVASSLGVVLHPRAIESATDQLGPGSVVLAGAVVLAYIALVSQGICFSPADLPTPSPSEHRKLLRDAWCLAGYPGCCP